MSQPMSLEDYLAAWATAAPERSAIAKTIIAIAEAARDIADVAGQGALLSDLASSIGANSAGDTQKELDVRANELLIAALRKAPVAAIASEELDAPLTFDATLPLAVALDPVDGSSNIDTNASIGTIFSILPMLPASVTDGAGGVFVQPGSQQKAAGYVIYGPQCSLVLTVGDGTHIFTLDRKTGRFKMTREAVRIPETTQEFAINASNYRHWSAEMRAYIGDCLSGVDGPRGHDYNMRWIASMVADAHRILVRGGVYLYPSDKRKGYERGRLRLVYEANPIALLVEQAGGKATDGVRRILDLKPSDVHQRTPLIFGSAEEVERIVQYKAEPLLVAERPQLFAERGLFRA